MAEKKKGDDDKGKGALLPETITNTLAQDIKAIHRQHMLKLMVAYADHLLKTKYKNSETKSLSDARLEAVKFIKLFYLTSQYEQTRFDVLLVRTAEDMVKMLRIATGLTKIEEWLRSNKTHAERVMRESGSEKQFKEMWNFDFSKQTSFFEGPEGFLSDVQEMFGWIQIVFALMANAGVSKRFRLTTASAGGKVFWDKQRVLPSLLVSVIVGKDSGVFTIQDLVDVITFVTKQDNWKQEFSRRLVEIAGEEFTELILKQRRIMRYVRQLSDPEHQVVTYFISAANSRTAKTFVAMPTADEAALKFLSQEMKGIIQKTVFRQVAQTSGGAIEQSDSAKEHIASYLATCASADLFTLLDTCPYMGCWFTEAGLVRASLYDTTDTLSQKLEGHVNYAEVRAKMYAPTSLANIVHQLSKGSKPAFDIDINFLEQEKALYKKSGNKGVEKHMAKLFNILSDVLYIDDLYQWMQRMEEKYVLKTAHIPLSLTLTQFYLFEVIPKVSLAKIKESPHCAYFEMSGMRAQFNAQVERQVEKILEKRRKAAGEQIIL